jgi:2-dehydro-3-deoxygluconokinase
MVTIGETMAGLVRDDAAGCYRFTAMGAESNVAAGMAQLGCRTRWISRLGDDELGRQVADFVRGHGVDAQVDWDPGRVTGVCVKELTPAGTRVRYYRSQAAVRHLDHDHLRHIGTPRWIHLTGVTPALSPSCAAVVTALATREHDGATRVSFDVNHRPALWRDDSEAARTLIPLARAADTVFIGDDEAERLLGTSDEAEVRRQLLIRDDQEVVLKRGPAAASLLTSAGTVTEPALRVEVVDVTGAGDAFAAGYLTAACNGWGPRERLRLGHRSAARVIGVTGDLVPSLERSERDRLFDAVLGNSHDGERTA